MRISLIPCGNAVHFKIVDGTAVSEYSPTSVTAMNLFSAKVVGLDSMMGVFIKSLLNYECAINYQYKVILKVNFGTALVILNDIPINSQRAAYLQSFEYPSTDPDEGRVFLSIQDLYSELERRVESIRYSIESCNIDQVESGELVIGTIEGKVTGNIGL